nr:hypothetical protein [Tanacetum cinerariifolium]
FSYQEDFCQYEETRTGFSRNVTPLFETMMVNAQEEVGEDLAEVYPPSSEIPVEESISTPSNDPLPSGEDNIQLNELMIFCTNLQQQVLDLEEAKIAQANEIAKLKKRVKKLENRRKSRPTGMRRLKKVGSITTASKVVTAASIEDSAAPTTETTADVNDELTLEKTLIAIKEAKPKIKPKRKQRQAAEVYPPSSEIPVKESISTPSNDPLPSGEDNIQLNELMIFCTNLQQQVLDLEEAKIAQANEIAKLKKRVKKLEKRR